MLQHITNADDGRSCCIHLKDSFHWNKHPCLAFKLYGPSIYTIMAKNHYRPFPDQIVKDLTLQICTAIQCMYHYLIYSFCCNLKVIMLVFCLFPGLFYPFTPMSGLVVHCLQRQLFLLLSVYTFHHSPLINIFDSYASFGNYIY